MDEINKVLKRTGYVARWQADGRKQGVLKVARNCLAEGLSPEIVAKTTELDLKTVLRLRDKAKAGGKG